MKKISFILLLVLINYPILKLVSQSQTYNTPGTYSFTVPDGVSSITAQVWGAGGGGSKGYLNQKGTGGGGGGFAQGTLSVNAGDVITVTIGAGGNGSNSAGTDGVSGSSSSLSFNSSSITATGGSGGTTTLTSTMSCSQFVSGLGGIGGTGSAVGFTSTSTYCGGSGANLAGGCSPTYTTPGGGGGGSASTGGNGREAGQTSGFGDCTSGSGPNGGTAISNGGAGGNGGTGNANGANGGFPGGGGGGNAGTGNGGNGAHGKVIITWTCSNMLTMGSNTQSQCSGDSIDQITYNIQGATDATVSGLPTGINFNYNNGTLTMSGASLQVGTFNYTVTPVGSCTSSTASGSLTFLNGNVKRNNVCYTTINDAINMGSGSIIEVLANTHVESFTIPSGVTLEIKNGATVTNAGTITNEGTIKLNPGGTFNNHGLYKGNGDFMGDFINQNSGKVAPGN
jgi:hypothetical protein